MYLYICANECFALSVRKLLIKSTKLENTATQSHYQYGLAVKYRTFYIANYIEYATEMLQK